MTLDEMEKLCEAATPGPWAEDGTLLLPTGTECDASAGEGDWITFKTNRAQADRAFWIAARTALPELIREKKRLRELYPSLTIEADETSTLREFSDLIHGDP